MSTADLTINAWSQTENTFALTPQWAEADDLELQPQEEAAVEAAPSQTVREPAPTLPDDLWQEWFGLWR